MSNEESIGIGIYILRIREGAISPLPKLFPSKIYRPQPSYSSGRSKSGNPLSKLNIIIRNRKLNRSKYINFVPAARFATVNFHFHLLSPKEIKDLLLVF